MAKRFSKTEQEETLASIFALLATLPVSVGISCRLVKSGRKFHDPKFVQTQLETLEAKLRWAAALVRQLRCQVRQEQGGKI